MKDYQFHVTLESFEPKNWIDIFNRFSFYKLHETNVSTFFSLKNTKGEIEGVIHFTDVGNNVFKSPHRGTFGGVNILKHDQQKLQYMLDCWEKELKSLGAKVIVISTAPFAHNQHSSTLHFNMFLNNEYRISRHEINYHIAIDEIPLIDKMKRNNKKRLRKCIRSDFKFNQYFENQDKEVVYQVIKANRESRGFPVTMSYFDLNKMDEAIPNTVLFFGLSNETDLIASAILIRINSSVLYVFYWGELPEFKDFSPVVMLASNLYEFARANQYKILDIGTATDQGKPNIGLMRFKENLGCIPSLKLTYTKELN